MSGSDSPIVCLILAAGFSRRFGQDKLLHRLPNGRSILAQTVSVYRQLGVPIVVITQCGKKSQIDIELGLDLTTTEATSKATTIKVIEHGCALYGLSQSIVAGVGHTDPKNGWLIGLADMPYIHVNTLNTLVACAQHNKVVLPIYNDQDGNPVFIGRNYRSALMDLTGDHGAKKFINGLANSYIDRVEVGDPGVLHDIDVPTDVVR